MTQSEIENYKRYLSQMNDDQLSNETYLIIKFPQSSAIAIQLCHNEWESRNNVNGFVNAYNRTLNPG